MRHPSLSSSPSLGLYFDFRNPSTWQRDPAAHYRWTLDLIAEADRRGIGSVWVTEHHFFEDGYLSQPLTALAAIAARTEHCRLGTAVVLAPLYPAVQIAEQAAIVDLVSNGRLELGLGAGYVLPEFEAYGADIAQRYPTTDATIAEVGRLLESGGVTPSSVQDPLPRWAGYLGPIGAGRAGRLGVGLLTLNRDSYVIYRDALEAAGHDPADARMAGVANFMVADDPESAYERVLPHLTHQLNSYRSNAAAGRDKPARKLSEDEVRSRGSGVIRPLEVLSAEEARIRVRTLTEDLLIEHLYVWASIGAMPHDLAIRQMELLTELSLDD